MKPLPSQAELHRILHYDPETGIFRWKYRHELDAKRNTQLVGAIAGRKPSNPKSYCALKINKVTYAVHRLAWLYHYGEDPHDLYVDHIDGDKHNNAIKNLRLATLTENNQNRKVNSNSRSGIRGVSRNRHGNWQAEVQAYGKLCHLGTFASCEAAKAAFNAAVAKLHGEFARPN